MFCPDERKRDVYEMTWWKDVKDIILNLKKKVLKKHALSAPPYLIKA